MNELHPPSDINSDNLVIFYQLLEVRIFMRIRYHDLSQERDSTVELDEKTISKSFSPLLQMKNPSFK